MIYIILGILALIALWKLSVALWLGLIGLFCWWAVWFSRKEKKHIPLPETPLKDLLKHSEPTVAKPIDEHLRPFEKRNVEEKPIRIPVKIVKVIKKYHAKVAKPSRKYRHS